MRRLFSKKRQPVDAAASSASSASTTIDDHPIPILLKSAWKPWAAAKRSLSTKAVPKPWQPPPPPPRTLPHDSDDDESGPDDDDDTSFNAPPVPATPPHPRSAVRRHLSNPHPTLPSVSPFVQLSNGPLFPRSINLRSRLPRPPDMRVAMFTKHLAAVDLSDADLSLLLPLASKPPPAALSTRPPSLPDTASSCPLPSTKIFPASPGLRRWISRPCFEDRNMVYLPSPSGIDAHPISSSRAVAALEYPEYLDVMVNPDFEQSLPPKNVLDTSSFFEPTLAATYSHASVSESTPVPAPSHSRNPYTATPSPLRNEHHSPTPAPTSVTESEDTLKPVLKTANVKRVVRFAEDDSDDGVPLHIVRMKKKRDQKSNFLRQEQLRRAKEEAEIRRQLEQEAIRFQQEALEKERSRLASEKERREKEKTMYAESLAATRARRELSRTGGLVSSNMSNPNSLLVPSASSTSLRDTERNKPPPSEPRRSSRLPHDAPPSLSIPRREASEFASQLNMPASFTTNHFSDSSSPDSSRPSSLAYSPSSPSYPYSRPPSTYSAHTSSSEDVRHQSGSKRNSLAASSTAPMYARAPMIASYPTWSGSNPHIQYIPPVPPFPDYVTDMPLLPPTAPFMKHSRQRSPSSSSRKDSSPAPSTQSSRRGSFNSSSDHVNTVAPKSSGSSLRAPSLSPRPPQQRHASTPTKPTHERRPSGESRMTSHTQRSSNTHRQQQPQMRPPLPSSHSHSSPARGRPEQPAWTQVQAQYMQAAGNPWMTGMPVMVPVSPAMYMGMPVYQYPLMPVMGGQMVLNPTQGMPLAMGGDQRRGSGGTPGEGSTTGGGRSQMHGIIS